MLFRSYGDHRDLHSFPTRRSSDLVTDEAKKWIIEKTASDRTYGARPLRRALQKYVEDPLSEALIGGGIAQRPAFLEVYMENNALFYRPIASDGEEKMAGLALTAV